MYWQTRILNTQEGEPRRLLPTEAALCSQTVGCTAVSLRLGFLASFHPITPSRKLSSPPYTGPPFGRPFLLARVASSIILGNPPGPTGETLPGPLPSSTPAWMTLTVLLPSPPPSPPSLGYPSSPFPGQSYFPALPPASSLGLGGIYHKLLPLQPLTSTDPSRDL